MRTNGILPCTTNPLPDELLSSWLIRLSHRHLSKVHTFCKLLFPSISIWNRDIDKTAPDIVLQTLAEKTLTPLKIIRNTTLKSYEGSLYLNHNSNGNSRWLMPLGIFHRNHLNYGLMYCPTCLKNDKEQPYYRKHWRLSFSFICTTCNTYLLDRCPCCNNPVVFFRTELGRKNSLPDTQISICYYCKQDLSSVPNIRATNIHLEMQNELFRIKKEGWSKSIIYPHLYFDVLFQLLKVLKSPSIRCQKLQENMNMKFNSSIPNITKYGRVPFEFYPIEIRIELIQRAFWLLSDIENNFIPVCKNSKMTSFAFLNDMDIIPFWYEQIIMENFYFSNINRRFLLTL